MTWIIPPHISEREEAHVWPNGMYDDAKDEDCVAVSGLMQYLAAKPGAAPATHYEAERIRQDAGLGPMGGMTTDNLIAGLNKRYGWVPQKVTPGFSVLWSVLVPGMSATASGRPSDCATSNPFRRFLQNYSGGHRSLVLRLDNTDRVWLMDPMGYGTYEGQWATKAQLAEFVKNGTSHTAAHIAQEEAMKSYPIPVAPQLAVIGQGTLIHTDASDVLTGRKDAGEYLVVDPGRDMPYLGEPSPGIAAIHRTTETGALTGVVWFVKKASITLKAVPAPVVPKPLATGVYKVG